MVGDLDEFSLEAIGQEHPVAVSMFVPFAIARLCRDSTSIEALLRVRLRDIGGQKENERVLRLFWSRESGQARPLAVQQHILTEWAALAVACVVL